MGLGLIEKVSASEYINTYNIVTNSGEQGQYGQFNYFYNYSATNNTLNYNYNLFNFDYTYNLSSYKNGELRFTYEIQLPIVSTTTTTTLYGAEYCREWKKVTRNSIDYYECTDLDSTTDSGYNDKEYLKPVVLIRAIIFYDNNNNFNTCEVNGTNIICPFNENYNNINGIGIYSYVYYSSQSYQYKVILNRTFNAYKNDSTIINDTINNQTENIIGETHTYNETPSETIDRTQMDEYQEAEDNLLNSIDLSGAEDIEVSINANASNFIWGIVNRLRGISGKIVLLFTSILSLGIIKMVMNR